MQRISPSGFAIALVLLTVVWMMLPEGNSRIYLFIVLVMGALAASGAPEKAINKFFGLIK